MGFTFLQFRFLLIVRGHLGLLAPLVLLLLVVVVLRTFFIIASLLALLILVFVLGIALRRTKRPSRLIALKDFARLAEAAELGTGKTAAEWTAATQYAAEPAGLSAVQPAKGRSGS